MTPAWPVVALREVATIERASVSADAIETGTTYVGLEHITPSGQLVGQGSVQAGELLSNKFRFTASHVLYGKLRPNLSKIVAPDFNGVCSTDILPLRPGERLDKRYLLRFLRQPSQVAKAAALASGANLPRLSPKVLAELPILLPPIEQQRRIASVLGQADHVRAKRRISSGFARQLERAVFEEFLLQAGDLARLPLAEVVEHVTVGHVGPTSAYFTEEGVPFIRTGNVGDGEIIRRDLRSITPDFHERLKKSALRSGDVLVSRVVSDQIRAVVVPPDLDGANCANVIVVRPAQSVTGRYLQMLIRLPESQALLLGRRVGSAQSVVNTRVLQQWEVPVPTPDQLALLDRRLAQVRSLAERIQSSAAALDSLFASLEQRAFAGQL